MSEQKCLSETSSDSEVGLEVRSTEDHVGHVDGYAQPPGVASNSYVPTFVNCSDSHVGTVFNRYDGDHFEHCTISKPSNSTSGYVGDEAHYRHGDHYDHCTIVERPGPSRESTFEDPVNRSSARLALDGIERRIRDKSDHFRTFCRMKTGDNFVRTTPCVEAEEVIKGEHSVLLIGGPGDGKSSILYYLSVNPLPGYLPIPCNSPAEMLKYIDRIQGTNIKLLFAVDDSFLSGWINMGNMLEMYLTEHKFVFASRKSVWNECKVHLGKRPFFTNVVEVTSAKLSTNDKRKLLQLYSGDVKRITIEETEDVVCDDNPIAFFQCCEDMAAAAQRGLSRTELVQIFKRPFSFLSSELEKMAEQEKLKYATLCLIMLCGGMIECEELAKTLSDTSSHIRERIEAIRDTCDCPNLTCGGLQKCADKLTGIFLERRQVTYPDFAVHQVYKFAHDSINEAVIMEYWKHHASQCLKFLHCDVIVKIVRPHHYRRLEHDFVISAPLETHREVAKVFTEKIIGGQWNLEDVFRNPLVREDKFQVEWCKFLISTQDKLEGVTQCKSLGGWCVLYFAARSGAAKLLRFLINRGVTCRCPAGYCPLSGAASGNQTHISSELIMSMNPTEGQIIWAVYSACRFGSANVLQSLLSRVKPDRRDDTLEYALAEACFYGHPVIAKYLLEKYYADCRSHVCTCRLRLLDASRNGDTAILSVLLCHGADVATTDCQGNSGLHLASRCGQTDNVRYLISHGAKVNRQNLYNVSPLHLASSRCHTGTVSALLENGAGVNMRDNWGQTPLHAAMMKRAVLSGSNRRPVLVRRLLENEADVKIKDKWDRTALDVAEHNGLTDILEIFQNHDVGVVTHESERLSKQDELDSESIRLAY